MEVVAEGVETPDCLAWLRQAGCDTVQGFLFARPMPAAAFVGFVNQWRNTTMNANEPRALLQIVGGDKLIIPFC
ncbi:MULTISPECIES: EAL domain-containing protein [Enterobacteriaceae]|uniref:EAL domain-containing protein n=1 Tax=Escherichia coli TaxID=562 RepID=UPI001ADDF352|nr:EAL domain-containing protein [Escherichia coli]MDT9126709.1 EAL domain-containing protein [Escherichia coli]